MFFGVEHIDYFLLCFTRPQWCHMFIVSPLLCHKVSRNHISRFAFVLCQNIWQNKQETGPMLIFGVCMLFWVRTRDKFSSLFSLVIDSLFLLLKESMIYSDVLMVTQRTESEWQSTETQTRRNWQKYDFEFRTRTDRDDGSDSGKCQWQSTKTHRPVTKSNGLRKRIEQQRNPPVGIWW